MKVSNATTEGLEESPDFHVVDVSLNKTLSMPHNMGLHPARLGVNNLFDEYQDDLESGAKRDSGYIYGPRLPRNFVIGCRVDF